jgi:hypothetical protein
MSRGFAVVKGMSDFAAGPKGLTMLLGCSP